MANLIMGLLELVMLVVWVLGSFLVGLQHILNFDLVSFDEWDTTTSIILIALFLFWNILVWAIKPLRTKFNYSETWWNLLFIAWLVIDMFI
jgi:hypothetical protein